MHTLFIDVDGTLIDSFPGIRASFLDALQRMDWPIPSAQVISHIPGPPMEVTMRSLGMNEGQAKQALAFYLEHYGKEGWKMSSPYPGIHQFLDRARDAGFQLCTATSKGEGFARLTLKEHGLLDFFDFLGAAEEDGPRRSKAAVIQHVLHSMNLESDTSTILMIGDRIHDIDGAKRFGIDTVAVDWGYGTDGERNSARYRAHDVDELESIVNEWSTHHQH